MGFKKIKDLFLVKAVIPTGHHIDTVSQKLFTVLGSQSEPMRRILSVGDNEVQRVFLSELVKMVFDNESAGFADNITDESYFQGKTFYRVSIRIRPFKSGMTF
jgi:hypothetical protein